MQTPSLRLCSHLSEAGGKAASFSSLGPFSERSWIHCQRLLFATRKQKNLLPSPCNHPSSHPVLPSSSHYSCLLTRSIHLSIRSPSTHLPSIFPSIHLCVSPLIHPSLTSLPPIHLSIIHHDTYLSSVLPPIHPSVYSASQGVCNHVGNSTWTRYNCH